MKSLAYPHFTDKKTAPRYLPDFSIDSILDIDFALLQKLGVKHILFDLDLTLRKANAAEIEASIIQYLVEARKAGQISTITLATNNIHKSVRQFSEPLEARVYQPFVRQGRLIRKPHPLFFERIIEDLKAQPHEIVMVGDKVQYDVGGGNRMGMRTILISPQGKDLLHDRLMLVRFREKRLLKSAHAALEIAKQVQK